MDTTKLLSLLKACINSKSLKQGKLIHQKILCLGLQNNITLCKSLINLYFSFHLFQSAKLVFKTIENPLDITLWNGLMAAYTKSFIFTESLELFHRLLHFPYLKPDAFTYPSVLKASGGLRRVVYGRTLHAHVIKSGFGLDVVVRSSVVGMYAKCDVFEDAIKLFEDMPARDVASWNNVISCYYQDGQSKKALELFEEMRVSGLKPDSVTLTTAISSCARLLDLERGKKIHMELVRGGFALDCFVTSSLVDMYGKCGCLETAKEVFEAMQTKNVVSWNSMIAGYSLKGDSKSCIEFFRRMNKEGIKPTSTTLSSILMACSRSVELQLGKFIHGYIIRNSIEADIFVNSSLIDLYFKCGKIGSAKNVFQSIPHTNVVSWNVMISGYVTAGSYLEALAIFTDMRKSGVKPDAVTFTSVLPACSQLAVLEMGKEIHNLIIENKLENNEVVMGALLDMYAKCGAVDEALRIFNRLPERDFVSWTSMIAAYGSHGQTFEALKLFEKMRQSNAKPDKVTFLTVLSACGHAGLVDEGYYYFNQMIIDYGLKPAVEHYSCLIDLLGRMGRLQEAFEILKRTPEIREDVGLLSTLFSACYLHKDLELGEQIGRFLIEKNPDDPSIYIILSNMYASVKKWDEVRKARLKIKELRLKKNPGCSWIEVGKKIHPFLSEDKSHPQADMIEECVSILASHMENHEVLSL